MATTEEILERYPQLAGFIDHPEIGQILKDAAAEGMGAQELQGKIYETDWYQRNWADFRKLEVLKSTDPAEYNKQRDQAEYEIKVLLGQLGVSYSGNPELVQRVTDKYLQHGKDEWFLYSHVGRLIKEDPNLIKHQGGQLGSKMTEYRKLAEEYLLPFGDDRLATYALNEWRQLDTREGVEQRMRLEAMKRYGHMEDELKRGLTVRQILQPMTNTVAQTLEMSPDQLDLSDPRWRPLLEHTDQDGNTRTMTTAEADRWARMQPEFAKTKTARDEVYDVSSRIIESMGKI